MHVEAETTVDRRRSEVFDYLARAEHLPEYVTDFAWVKQVSDEEPSRGTRVGLVMEPRPGGLFKVIAPLMRLGMRNGNAKALERLKQRLESGTAASN